MTCIIAWLEKDEVWMGGDSQSSFGTVAQTCAKGKVVKRGEYVLGAAGRARMDNLLRHRLCIPEHPADMDQDEFMCTLFVDAFRDAAKGMGFGQKANEFETVDANTLIGYRGQIYLISGDYCVWQNEKPYSAIGSGNEVAYGALAALANMKITPESRIKRALEISAEFVNGVRGPFTVVSTGKKGKANGKG